MIGADIIDERPISLREAAELYHLGVSTLRAEASRGRLDIFRLGKRDYTTVQAMREMVRKCQEEGRRRVSTLIGDGGNGLSETDRTSSAQAALKQTVTALKQNLPRISPASTSRSHPPPR
jgi:hypothetical protein